MAPLPGRLLPVTPSALPSAVLDAALDALADEPEHDRTVLLARLHRCWPDLVAGLEEAYGEAAEPLAHRVAAVAVAAFVQRPAELRLLDLQREAIGDGGIVVEGRDIGSVVWPQAEVKVYLSADPDARAERRAAEEGGADLASTQQSLLERDRIDSGRATAPLTMADGAVHVDSTHLTLDEVVETILALAGSPRP